MKNQLFRVAAGLVFAAGVIFAQAPAKPPAFEVATIRQAPPITSIVAQLQQGKVHVGMTVDQARVDIGFLSINDLIPIAFKVKPYQVTGPDSMKADRWDILATIPEGVSKDLVPEMLQALLKERFKLEFHRDSKEQNVYALVVGKDGPKMKPADPDADKPPAEEPKGGQTISTGGSTIHMSADNKNMTVSGPQGPMRITMPDVQNGGAMHMEMLKVSMASLVDVLSPMMDKPVVDLTGLKGNFQLSLDLPIEQIMAMARAQAATLGVPMGAPGGPGGAGGNAALAASDPSGSSMFKGVQQLGLRLEARKVPIELIVVDHVEKTPTEN